MEKMELNVIGVFRMAGKSKESGNPYDFAQLLYLKPIEPVANANMTLRGFGFEVSKVDLSNEALEKFGQLTFPARIEVTTDTVPSRSGFRTVVVGYKLAAAAQRQAA
jgi:hypothetical protein